MSVLPSPIPHPLDFMPWDVPGWVYEALEWVVGAEWPEGNEKEVWDLADRWFEVASILAGPRQEAHDAAAEVVSAYGHTGAVALAFQDSWQKIAGGDEAPLNLLPTISHEIGQMVQECGCDIEAAKIEVWIQLGILIGELIGLGIAVVLTAGAASPAAAAAITATRTIVQQIFRRLVSQLAQKAVRKGLKKVAQKAAKEVGERGLRRFAKRAGIEGLEEMAEEVSIDLGTQLYQNTTGRRDGVDFHSLGMSALGGFAGGAGASLAGLGPHATSRLGRIGENFGREMGAEVLGETAASLATGGGLPGLDDLGRAATSGLTSSAIRQSTNAVNRLQGQLAAMSNIPVPPVGAPPPSTLPASSSGSGAFAGTSFGGTSFAAPAPAGGPAAGASPGAPSSASSGMDRPVSAGSASSGGSFASTGAAAASAATPAVAPAQRGADVNLASWSTTAESTSASMSGLGSAGAAATIGSHASPATSSTSIHSGTAGGVQASPSSGAPAVAGAGPVNAGTMGVTPAVTTPATAGGVGPTTPTTAFSSAVPATAQSAAPATSPSTSTPSSATPASAGSSTTGASSGAPPRSTAPVSAPSPAQPVSPSSGGPVSSASAGLASSPTANPVSSTTARPISASAAAPPLSQSAPSVSPATSPPVTTSAASSPLTTVSAHAPAPTAPSTTSSTTTPSTTGPSTGTAPSPSSPAVEGRPPGDSRSGADDPRVTSRQPGDREAAPAVVAAFGRPVNTSPAVPPSRPRIIGNWGGRFDDPAEVRAYHGWIQHSRQTYEFNRRDRQVRALIDEWNYAEERARQYAISARRLREEGKRELAEKFSGASKAWTNYQYAVDEEIDAIRAGQLVPDRVDIDSDDDFRNLNEDVGRLALGAVETGDISALTGSDRPPSADTTRPYGKRGGLRPPLAQHQIDLERAMPRDAYGNVIRTADPREGYWFQLSNDGGPAADPTRGLNCLDCALSFYETWMHGRPRVSAPRTFDSYADGDVNRPLGGEVGGPGRVEDVTGGRFLQFTPDTSHMDPAAVQQAVYQGYRDLHLQLLAAGHGSFAFILNEWEGGGTHAWVAINQNGTILYLDPQQGTIAENNPQYKHWGVPYPGNVVSLNALVLDPNGRPLPSNRPQGKFSQRPPLTPPAHDTPDINRLHLLLGPDAGAVSGPPSGPRDPNSPAGTPPVEPGSAPTDPTRSSTSDEQQSQDPQRKLRQARQVAQDALASQQANIATIIANARDLNAVFEAGVTPAQAAAHLDVPTLRRLAPHLRADDVQAVADLFADERVRNMLHATWEDSRVNPPMLAETLVHQLVNHPDLVRLMHRSEVLFNCFIARPLTLHHVALHQKAIDVLDDVVTDIERRGAEAVAAEGVGKPPPARLTPEMRRISAAVAREVDDESAAQPGFDSSRKNDAAYISHYLEGLYKQWDVAQQELTELAKSVARECGGKPGWRTNPKDRRRAMDKIKADYEGDASSLVDLAGAKVEFQKLTDLYAALDRLIKEPGVQIVRFKDRFQKPQDSGYRDVQLCLRLSNGHIGEFRLHLAAMDEINEWEHALYEVRRDIDALAAEAGREKTVDERALRDGLLREVQRVFDAALESAYGEEE